MHGAKKHKISDVIFFSLHFPLQYSFGYIAKLHFFGNWVMVFPPLHHNGFANTDRDTHREVEEL
jgi:hypothetical protein